MVAAGSSTRMGGLDKLDAELDGRSVLRWSVEVMAAAGVERIVVVTAPARIPELASAPWLPDQVVAVVAGGARRQESVAAGVAALTGARAGHRKSGTRVHGKDELEAHAATGDVARDPVILVHDAARPLVSSALVRAVAAAAASNRRGDPGPGCDRNAQATGRRPGRGHDRPTGRGRGPDTARRSALLLERAYAAYPPDGPETWTDEASLLEACKSPSMRSAAKRRTSR